MEQLLQVLGTWEDEAAMSGDYSSMELHAGHLTSHWYRTSLSSDYWAYYNSRAVPQEVAEVSEDNVQDVLSYLFNELLENCAKFSSGENLNLFYQSWSNDGALSFQFTNHIHPEKQKGFVALIEEILGGDLDELYFKKLEENVESNKGGSGLGYLTLMKDFAIRFGFRFRPQSATSTAVDVQAHVNIREIV